MKSLYDYIVESYIVEGGAAGHMLHPYMLPQVSTLEDLVQYYYNLSNMFRTKERKSFVKIDGVNVSLRFVNGEFAVDRLTKDPLDVVGTTLDKVKDRFGGNAHGYDNIVYKVLQMFDEAIPQIRSYLSRLGLLDDDLVMLNVEYIEGKTNRVDYNTNFIAIHGLLHIETNERGSRKTVPINYNQKDLDDLASVLNNIFIKHGFECYTLFPAIMTSEPDYDEFLNSKFTVVGIGSHTIREWMNIYKDNINKTATLKTLSGKRVQATSLELFNNILHGVDVHTLVEDKYINILLPSFFMLYINAELGVKVLECFENDKLGSTSNQEGIVIYDNILNKTNAPVKITGHFIYR